MFFCCSFLKSQCQVYWRNPYLLLRVAMLLFSIGTQSFWLFCVWLQGFAGKSLYFSLIAKSETINLFLFVLELEFRCLIIYYISFKFQRPAKWLFWNCQYYFGESFSHSFSICKNGYFCHLIFIVHHLPLESWYGRWNASGKLYTRFFFPRFVFQLAIGVYLWCRILTYLILVFIRYRTLFCCYLSCRIYPFSTEKQLVIWRADSGLIVNDYRLLLRMIFI